MVGSKRKLKPIWDTAKIEYRIEFQALNILIKENKK